MPFKNPHPLYSVWQGMRRRCLTPTTKQWADYGGRGISICPEWDDFHQFVADMGSRPSPKHSLDRIDNEKDYSPSNCRWATHQEQMRNRRVCVFLEFEGAKYPLVELAAKSGIKPDTIVARHAKGMTLDECLAKTRYLNYRKPVEAIEARVAAQAASTHCKNGHPWNEENTRITPEGWKNCRACHRAKMKRRNANFTAAASAKQREGHGQERPDDQR